MRHHPKLARLWALVGLLSLTQLGCAPQSFNEATMEHIKQQFDQRKFATLLPRLQQWADHNDPEAQYRLGYMYFYGYGVATNRELADTYLKKAAAQGHGKAKWALKKKQAMAQAQVAHMKVLSQLFPIEVES